MDLWYSCMISRAIYVWYAQYIYIYTLYMHMYIHMRNVCMRMDLKPRGRWSRNMGRRRDAETRIVHPAGWRWRGTHIPCSTLISLIHIFWWRKSHWKSLFDGENPIENSMKVPFFELNTQFPWLRNRMKSLIWLGETSIFSMFFLVERPSRQRLGHPISATGQSIIFFGEINGDIETIETLTYRDYR